MVLLDVNQTFPILEMIYQFTKSGLNILLNSIKIKLEYPWNQIPTNSNN